MKGHARARWLVSLVVAAGVVSVGAAAHAQALGPPIRTTPSGSVFDRLNRSSTQPVPSTAPLAPRPSPTADVWVPDQYVRVPGRPETFTVPGHWERNLGNGEVYAPPLTGTAPGGPTVTIPGGQRPPLEPFQRP
jgi:hypothetical protein